MSASPLFLLLSFLIANPYAPVNIVKSPYVNIALI